MSTSSSNPVVPAALPASLETIDVVDDLFDQISAPGAHHPIPYGDETGTFNILKSIWRHARLRSGLPIGDETSCNTPALRRVIHVSADCSPMSAAIRDARSSIDPTPPILVLESTMGHETTFITEYDLLAETPRHRFGAGTSPPAKQASPRKRRLRKKAEVPSDLDLLDVAALAQILKCEKQTIYNKLSAAPHMLPPRVSDVGKPLWAPEVVRAWLASFSTAPKRRRGRPTKREQIVRKALDGAYQALDKRRLSNPVDLPIEITVDPKQTGHRAD